MEEATQGSPRAAWRARGRGLGRNFSDATCGRARNGRAPCEGASDAQERADAATVAQIAGVVAASWEAAQGRNENTADGRPRGRENQRRGADGRGRSHNPQASASDDDSGAAGRRAPNLEEQRREAMAILKQILEQMGEPTDVRQIEVDAETVEIEIKGDGSGILIGRHGQTLDALEYIVNRILARRIKDAAPISLETESYRARRRQQLARMALSMGEKAKREHKPVRLEPMPPRDRRVVHLALKDDPMITTRSAGDGIMRSIEIVPSDGGGRPQPRGDGQDRGRRRDGGGSAAES